MPLTSNRAGTSGEGSYDNLTPVPVTVGGVTAGTTFNGVAFDDVFTDLFYPTIAPSISLSSLPAGGTREIGTNLASIALSATTVRNTNPITLVEFYRGGGLIRTVPSPLPGGGIETYTDSNPVSSNTTFNARVSDGSSTVVSNTISFNFLPGIYYGVSNAVINSGAGIVSAFGSGGMVLGSSRAVSYTFDASVGGGANYLYIAYPASFGLPASTLFNGFAFTAYSVTTVSLTNASGYTQNYHILKTDSSYNGASMSWQIL